MVSQDLVIALSVYGNVVKETIVAGGNRSRLALAFSIIVVLGFVLVVVVI